MLEHSGLECHYPLTYFSEFPGASWDHLSEKLFLLKSLSQGMLMIKHISMKACCSTVKNQRESFFVFFLEYQVLWTEWSGFGLFNFGDFNSPGSFQSP